MGRRKQQTIEDVKLQKLVHGGQCIATLPDGRKLLIWGGLPGETVTVKITKNKRSYLEGVVTEVIAPSDERIKPAEPNSFLSTSPWQIMTADSEDHAKKEILNETFKREGISNARFADVISDRDNFVGYRNKQEFGFWGDDEGLHLAHYVRGTHGKQKIEGSILVNDCMNVAARAIRDELNRLGIWGGKLKTVILRASESNNVVGALFVKEKLDLSAFTLPKELKGLDIYYSNPKSPASVPTEKIYSLGDIKLMDRVGGINITYDVLSFFQVNIPIFEQALTSIKRQITNYSKRPNKLRNGEGEGAGEVVDMYSGVGTIGLSVGATKLVESDQSNIKMATKNADGRGVEVVHATAETALKYIVSECTLILDPPRAGLHRAVIDRINKVKPGIVIYLSCNPSTQARDVRLLEENYTVKSSQGFNFFPRTPHIESLVMLELE